ncbi:3'-5' exonuclease [Marinobacterium sp. AK62]|uniref:3'-5' exonuclease n=1 Tax=Marinobacterium alkalitolerans TaxID=1542925 RepID=A0ABS3Z8X9_9GAMM|nr:3'-5' exonuclease [Marinobacterium alkalitolerans]MBP0048144.1 3'-5' exonuclease [Marinobacterium alkalitolerans]
MLYLSKERLQNEPSLEVQDTGVQDWQARFRHLAETARYPALKAFYEAGAVAPDTPLEEVPLVAVDFETTSLDPQKGGIVSIGLVPMTIHRIHSSRARHWVLKPRARLSSESVVVHGITHSEIESAPDLRRILDELLEQLQGKVLVVHHRGIERAFLNNALKVRIREGIEFPVIDTMDLEARLHRKKPLGFWDRLLGRKPVSIRLAQSRERYHLPFYRPHHALTDAIACGELLLAQVADRYPPDTPVSELWR